MTRSRTAWPLAPIALTLMAACAAPESSAPPAVSPPATATTTVSVAATSAPTASTSTPHASATAIAPVEPTSRPVAPSDAMPKAVASCDAADAAGSFGTWVPSIDDLVTAVRALPDYCVVGADVVQAARACTAKLGKTMIKLGVGDENAINRCWVSFLPAEWNGRRWIAGQYFFQNGAQFAASGAAVELKNGRASLYLENGGRVASCDTRANSPKGMLADFAAMPKPLALVLCGYDK